MKKQKRKQQKKCREIKKEINSREQWWNKNESGNKFERAIKKQKKQKQKKCKGVKKEINLLEQWWNKNKIRNELRE